MRAHAPVLSRHDVPRLSNHEVPLILNYGDAWYSPPGFFEDTVPTIEATGGTILHHTNDPIAWERVRVVGFIASALIEDPVFKNQRQLLDAARRGYWAGRILLLGRHKPTNPGSLEAHNAAINADVSSHGMHVGGGIPRAGLRIQPIGNDPLLEGVSSIRLHESSITVGAAITGGTPLWSYNGIVMAAHQINGNVDWVLLGGDEIIATSRGESSPRFLQNLMTTKLLDR